MGCGASSSRPPGPAVDDLGPEPEQREPAAIVPLVSTAPPRRLLLDSGVVPDELLLRVLSFLSAAELACLECVSRRFAGVSPASDSGVRWVPPRPEPQWSIVREAGRRRLVARSGGPLCTTLQWDPYAVACVAHAVLCGASCSCRPRWRHPVPEEQGKERWVQLAYELELAKLPLLFDRSDATITLSEGGALATKTVTGVTGGAVASSRKIMRTGRHFAEFTVVHPDGNALAGRFGLIRPGVVSSAASGVSEFREAFAVKDVSFEVVSSPV
jgi:hypothetical protein